MNILKVLNLSKKSVVPSKRIPSKAQSERLFTPAHNAPDFLSVVRSHGDRVAYEYFVSPTETATLSYTAFADKVKAFSSALTQKGLAGKRIALIGETTPEWVAT